MRPVIFLIIVHKHLNQVSIDSNHDIHKHTLSLFQLLGTNAATIFSANKDVLIKCLLPIFLSAEVKLSMEPITCVAYGMVFNYFSNRKRPELCMPTV